MGLVMPMRMVCECPMVRVAAGITWKIRPVRKIRYPVGPIFLH